MKCIMGGIKMKVKYSISSKYNPSLVEPIITLENDTCESVNEIISVIINHLKSIDKFNKCFSSKQQYKSISEQEFC